MTQNYKNILRPEYLSKFACIGSACEQTCCDGWGVNIDRETFIKYRACEDAWLKPLFREKVIRSETADCDENYSVMILSRNACPFLDESKLCEIQKRLGEDYLSRTCAIYPRNMNRVDDTLEISLNISCPEAARSVLLNAGKMKFVQSRFDGTEKIRFGDVPALSTTDPNQSNKPYQYFREVRELIISLLQNRSYDINDRLIILGFFCDDLERLFSRGKSSEIPILINRYSIEGNLKVFEKDLKMFPDDPGGMLKMIISLIDLRINSGIADENFHECFNEFKTCLGCAPETTEEEMRGNYYAAYLDFYKPFFASNGHILENYLVNYVFKNLFPFGPQKGAYQKMIYMVPKSIFTEYTLLVFHYVLIKSLLIGCAGFHQQNFGPERVVRLFHTFAKNVEHGLPYLMSVIDFFDRGDMKKWTFMAGMIKN